MALSRRSRFVVLGLVLLVVVGGFAVWQLVGVFSGAGLTPRQADAELADEILAGHARLQAALPIGSGTLERWYDEPLPDDDELSPIDTSPAKMHESRFYLREGYTRLDRHPQINTMYPVEDILIVTPEMGYSATLARGNEYVPGYYRDIKQQLNALLRDPLGAAHGGHEALIVTLLNTPGFTLSRRPFEDIPDAVWLEGELGKSDESQRHIEMRFVLDPRYDYAVRDAYTHTIGGLREEDFHQRVQLTELPDGSYIPHEVETTRRNALGVYVYPPYCQEVVRIQVTSQEEPPLELFALESLKEFDVVLSSHQQWRSTSLVDQVEDVLAAAFSFLPGNRKGGPFSFALIIIMVCLLIAAGWLIYLRLNPERPTP